MKSGIHLVMLGVLLAALLTGCGGNKSTDPSRAGRLENGDRQLSDGSYVDIYMCRATANGNASIDMSSPSLECLIAVVRVNSDNTATAVASSNTAGPAVTASWEAVKGQTYAVGVSGLHQQAGDYTLTFHDLDSITTRAAAPDTSRNEFDALAGMLKR